LIQAGKLLPAHNELIRRRIMYSARFQKLMTTGYGLASKLHFKELAPREFDQWVQDCRSLLSKCEPEPDGFPWWPDERHIEEIVFLLQKVLGQISRREIQYMGIL
jgi:hypothetical protein